VRDVFHRKVADEPRLLDRVQQLPHQVPHATYFYRAGGPQPPETETAGGG
jgi:hypothetical protein